MSTTTSDNTPADRGRPIKPLQLGSRGGFATAWHCWRAQLRKARAFLPVTLALFAITACDGAAGTTASRGSSCPGSVSIAWSSISGVADPSCPGSVSLTWSITNAAGQPSSCFQSRATSVALRLQSRTGGAPVFTAFACTASPGTANVAPGLYDVAIELHDASGARIATAPLQSSVAVALGRTTPLAPAGFVVNSGGGGGGGGPSGHVLLNVQAAGFTSNCLASGGAGITGTSITIVTDGGSCAAVRLIRTRGGVEVGTYQVDCGSPSVTACIEADESLTAPDLAPGGYVMHVRGSVGAATCYAADTALEVPQAGQLKKPITMQRQAAPGC